MKNLKENFFGISNLTKEESVEIAGGIGFLASVAAGAIIAGVAEVISDWDNFERGLTGQPYKE